MIHYLHEYYNFQGFDGCCTKQGAALTSAGSTPNRVSRFRDSSNSTVCISHGIGYAFRGFQSKVRKPDFLTEFPALNVNLRIFYKVQNNRQHASARNRKTSWKQNGCDYERSSGMARVAHIMVSILHTS